MLSLYKSIVAWRGTQVDARLLQALDARADLSPAIKFFGLDFAPDLQSLFAEATFVDIFMKTGSISQATPVHRV